MTAVLLLTLAIADSPYKVEAGDRDPPAEVTAGLRAALVRRAAVVTDGDDAALTVWFRDVLPVQATPEQVANGVGYRELPDGTLVAVVRLHRPFTDYRKQRIPAGVYTLRFAVQPEVGDHAGTSPHPEFLLLSPAETDLSIDRVEPADLLARSRKAIGGDHPAVMLLAPATGATDKPRLMDRSGGLRVLVVRRPGVADGVKLTLGLGLVVAGTSPTR